RNMTGNYARSPQGQPAKCPKSLTRGTRISTAGALTVEGVGVILALRMLSYLDFLIKKLVTRRDCRQIRHNSKWL
ncbi:MAG: hypothetical protein QM487_14265, partial [Candidatus Marithrix sp.]